MNATRTIAGIEYRLYDAAETESNRVFLNTVIAGRVTNQANCLSGIRAYGDAAGKIGSKVIYLGDPPLFHAGVTTVLLDAMWANGSLIQSATARSLLQLQTNWRQFTLDGCVPIMLVTGVMAFDNVSAEPGTSDDEFTAQAGEHVYGSGSSGTEDPDLGDWQPQDEQPQGLSTGAKVALGALGLLGLVILVKAMR